ncbi:MAG: pirin family protein [Chitinophagales bacterium]|nr:pirin family protein [Chitinophagaceae bacterium]MCB9063929.1 pirin family protein [Chitinophagales bacterium]
MSNTVFHSADTRGHANHGWLNAKHSFSFAGHYDPERIQFGALRVLNDDIIAPGMGFGKHPHDNMEIITIILDGALEHRDSMGHGEVINPDEVQVMSAGSGIFHSEFNHNKDREVNVLQSWIFTKTHNVEPRYDQTRFPEADRVNKWQTLVSPIDNEDPGLKIHQDAWMYRSKLEKGNSITHALHTDRHGAYIFLINGKVTIDGQELSRRDAMGITNAKDVTITASEDSDVLMYEVPMDY